MNMTRGLGFVVVLLLLCVCIPAFSVAKPEPVMGSELEGEGMQGDMPDIGFFFIENVGQAGTDIEYYSNDGSVTFGTDGLRIGDVSYNFDGSLGSSPVGMERCSWDTNFFLGSDPTCWHTNVASYRAVVYDEVWDGIDLVYYEHQGGLKYDLVLAPGADPENILIEVDGGRPFTDGDSLNVKSDSMTIIDDELDIFYEDSMLPVQGQFVLRDGGYGFQLDNYDNTKTLVIDPVVRMTYVGGDGGDEIYDMERDTNGDLIVSGISTSLFPTTAGSLNQTYVGGPNDGYVAKISGDLNTLKWATYIGGTEHEYPLFELDDQGNIVLWGNTASDDFPTTPGAWQETYGGIMDGFISKLASSGDSLIFSTYFGGSEWDRGMGLVVNENGTYSILGCTESTNIPTTANAYQATHPTTDQEGFILLLSADGKTQKYGSYIGGSGTDFLSYLTTDGENLWVGGYTQSNDFPTVNAMDNSYNAGNDIILFEFNITGSSLDYSTYIGGSGNENVASIQFAKNGDLILGGHTESADLEMMTTSYDFTHNGDRDFFVYRFNIETNEKSIGTFIGGSQQDTLSTILLDDLENIIITGKTGGGFPTSTGAFDESFNGGFDAALSVLKADGKELLYSTYIGGSVTDYGSKLILDTDNDIILGGTTSSDTDFPETAGTWLDDYPGSSPQANGFIIKFDLPTFTGLPEAPFDIQTVRGNQQVNVTWIEPEDWRDPITNYKVYRGTTPDNINVEMPTSNTNEFFIDSGLTNGVTYYYQVTAVNGNGEGPRSEIVNATPLGTPSPVRNLAATAGDGYVHLSWDPPADTGGTPITEYLIDRTDSLGGKTSFPGNGTQTEYNDTSITNNVTYNYSVTATSDGGYSQASTYVEITPWSGYIAPINLILTWGDKFIRLDWDHDLESHASGNATYEVYRQNGSGSFVLLADSLIQRTYNDTNIVYGNAYQYMVRVFTTNIVAKKTLTIYNYPSAARDLSTDAGYEWVNLTWRPPADMGGDTAVSYSIYYGTNTTNLSLIETNFLGTGYNFTGLKQNTAYHFMIVAGNKRGNGPGSKLHTTKTFQENRAPTITTISPSDGSRFNSTTEIEFIADAEDLDGDSLTYTWTSNISGLIGTTGSFYKLLPVGYHKITINITDGESVVSRTFEVYVYTEDEPFIPTDDDDDDPRSLAYVIIFIVVMVAVTLVLLVLIVVLKMGVRDKRGEDVLENLMEDYLNDRNGIEETTDDEMKYKLEEQFESGEISRQTYEDAIAIIEDAY